MPIETRLTMQALDLAVEEALEDTVYDFTREIDDLMSASRWAWPNQTKRANGQLAGTIRDVIDLGKLSDPANRTEQKEGLLSWVVTWHAPYAAAVFLGATFKKRAYVMPGRNVPEAALKEMGFANTFAAHLKGRL